MMAAPLRPAWDRVEAALDALLDLPEAARDHAILRIAQTDRALADELRSLVSRLDDTAVAMDCPAVQWLSASTLPTGELGLGAGAMLGPYRLGEVLGYGGMGEVHRGERVDGQFDQQVAIKLVHLGQESMVARFHAERQILARLAHPGIAAIYDGGVAPDGRPYMVMELVNGLPILEWCRSRHLGLDARLSLFRTVCEAVAYAHSNLVVHRDLKPSNVLVTAEGRAKLIDFGIARLLDDPVKNQTIETIMTPNYAAPEQLLGKPVTTATDIYALGLLLFEMLAGQPVFDLRRLSLLASMQLRATQPTAPRLSQIAREREHDAPVPWRLLRGDLDAIVAKALREAPEQRYSAVSELVADVGHFQQSKPVQARRGNWAYVVGRAMRRHRALAAGSAVAMVAITVGVVAVVWQAEVARSEARRATAVKDFLLQVFRASDPRVAADKPRGQITARELLDASASRIEAQFAVDAALQVELLGEVASIYRELGEAQRYKDLAARRLAVAQQHPGKFETVKIETLIDEIADSQSAGQTDQLQALLLQADTLLHKQGLDESPLRARWWLARGQTLNSDSDQAREAAFRAAIGLFEKVAPRDPGRVTALTELGVVHFYRADVPGAIALYQQALKADENVDNRDDGEMQTIFGNLGTAYMNIGEFEQAVGAYRSAAELAEHTYGKRHANYWYSAANHARVVHLSGDHLRADAMFEALIAQMPDPASNVDAMQQAEIYGGRLLAEGRPALALRWLEPAERMFQSQRHADNDLRRVRLVLGDAYDRLGRAADARRVLKAAVDEYAAIERADRQTAMAARERWGRFLLTQGDLDAAKSQFESVLAQDQDRHFAHTALAQAGLAAVALGQGQSAHAVEMMSDAWHRWQTVRGFRDVRMEPYLLRLQAHALIAAGELGAARFAAQTALDESLRYDAPEAASITEARKLLQQAATQVAKH